MWSLFRLSVCLLALCSDALAISLIPNFNHVFQHLDLQGLGFKFTARIESLFHGGFEAFKPLAQAGQRIKGLNIPTPKPGCRFSRGSCNCWHDDFNIMNDFDAQFPKSGKTVTYDLEITNTTMAPDGVERLIMAVNGQYPGPTLIADWGDTMVVNVKNSLENNGTGIHFHGLRQLNSNGADGTNGLTECPIAPGQAKTYTFKCTQHGTSWYHSHFSIQYTDGVLGGIIINGPAGANYDEDLGVYLLNDWFHRPAFELAEIAAHSVQGPPGSDNGLINGTMKSPDGTLGEYSTINVEKGHSYRLRVANVGSRDHFHFSVDGHMLTVISSDFTPVVPFTTSSISIAIGQRYDVIINADQDIDNYWIRSDPDSPCSDNANAGNIKGILVYSEAPGSTEPISTRHDDIPDTCDDMAVTPTRANTVPSDCFAGMVQGLKLSINVTQQNGPVVHWYIDGSAMAIDWSYPTVQYVLDGNTSYPEGTNIVQLDEADAWYYFVLQTAQGAPVSLPHPVHLHGHDFYILGTGPGMWDGNIDALQFDNPPRRDTATLPAGGYLILAFPADNPGVWLMHCHIPFHVGQGFALQFLERVGEIENTMDVCAFTSQCAAWKDYYDGTKVYSNADSGV